MEKIRFITRPNYQDSHEQKSGTKTEKFQKALKGEQGK